MSASDDNHDDEASDYSTWWLMSGQFHCDTHRAGIPFFFAPPDAVCAECSGDAANSYLRARVVK